MRKSSVSLTQGPIFKGLLLFAIPLLLSNLFQQLYNSVDSAIVGSYAGDAALAAVGSTAALINLIIGFFLGISTGTNILYAMHFGAGDRPGLKKLINSAMLISIICGAIISVLGAVGAETMLIWMGTPEDVLPLATEYLRIYMAGTIVTLIYNVGAGMIRAEGDSTRPLIYLVIGGVTNFILDMVFVAWLGMGAAGAALATILAQAVSAVLIVIRLCRLPEDYRLKPLKMRMNGLTVWDITRISVPCGLQGSMFAISNLLVQSKINSFGSIAMAGVAAYSKIDGFIYMPLLAISLAVSTYVGQNIGAGQFDRVQKGIKTCLLMSLVTGAIMGTGVLLLGENIVSIFTKTPEAQAYALTQMRYMAPFVCIFVFSDVFGGAIRGAGSTVTVTIISALCICVFRILWLTILLPMYNDIRILFLCYPISWTLSSLATSIYYFKGSIIKKTIRQANL
ncbi:MAG: MATE family efflux transporter [Oscillospiraceae bacterium]|nr:MATE family efflux transporter [Oscillospiraceae bacterium]